MTKVRNSLAIFLLLFPFPLLASVRISEVMYDLEGTDTGREWIEIENIGSASVDLSNYRLLEAGVNHTLTLIEGSAVLAPGGVAVIADDTAKFKADWPAFGGTLFDSAFSLSNTGETLSIKDGSLAIEDTATYSSDLGGAGDGSSLHRSGSTFSPGSPTPGSVALSAPPPAPESSPVSELQAVSQEAGAAVEPTKITVYAGGDRVLIAGASALFEGRAFGLSGKPMSGPGVRFLWNFGDGATAEGERVMHSYPYPGTYILTLSVSSSDYSGTDRASVDVSEAAVSLRSETDGSISVFNRSGQELDISLWLIGRGEKTFIFPRGTLVPAQAGIRIAPQLLNLPLGTSSLFFPNGVLAAREGDVDGDEAVAQGLIERVPLPPQQTVSRVYRAPVAQSPVEEPTTPASPQKAVLETQGAALVRTSEEGPLWPWLLATLGLIVLGGMAALFIRRFEGNSADAYEIIDETELKG